MAVKPTMIDALQIGVALSFYPNSQGLIWYWRNQSAPESAKVHKERTWIFHAPALSYVRSLVLVDQRRMSCKLQVLFHPQRSGSVSRLFA
jgi:hypothetical protein